MHEVPLLKMGETQWFSLVSFDVLCNGCAGDFHAYLKGDAVASANPDRVSVEKKEKYPYVGSTADSTVRSQQ
jgi:hypothetical protein